MGNFTPQYADVTHVNALHCIPFEQNGGTVWVCSAIEWSFTRCE